MTLDKALDLVRDFLSDKLFGYEFDDFLNSKQTGPVEAFRLDIINNAMPLSFDKTAHGSEKFKEKIVEIFNKHADRTCLN